LDSDDVPDLDPENFGWKKDMSIKSLTPVAIPESVPMAPDYLLLWLQLSESMHK